MAIEQLGESLLAEARKKSKKQERKAKVFTGLMLGIQAGNWYLRNRAKKRAEQFWASNQGLLDQRASQFNAGVNFYNDHNAMLKKYGSPTDQATGENWVHALTQTRLKEYQDKHSDLYNSSNQEDKMKFNEITSQYLKDDIEAYRQQLEGYADFRNIDTSSRKESKEAYLKPLKDKLNKGLEIINKQDNIGGWMLGGMNLKSEQVKLDESGAEVLLPAGFSNIDKSELDNLLNNTLSNMQKVKATYQMEEIPEIQLKALMKKEKVEKLKVPLDKDLKDGMSAIYADIDVGENTGQYKAGDFTVDVGKRTFNVGSFLNEFEFGDGSHLSKEQKKQILDDALIIADYNYKIWEMNASKSGAAGLTIPEGGKKYFLDQAIAEVIGGDLTFKAGKGGTLGFQTEPREGTYNRVTRLEYLTRIQNQDNIEIPDPSQKGENIQVSTDEIKTNLNISTDTGATNPLDTPKPQEFKEQNLMAVLNDSNFIKLSKQEQGKVFAAWMVKYPESSDKIREIADKYSKDRDMTRVDGTKKSEQGFVGPIKNNVTGQTMTEVSIQFDDVLDGQPIPVLVPTLSDDEIKTLQNMEIEGNAKNIPQSIKDKAIKHAEDRVEQGLSPFYQDGEQSISLSQQEMVDKFGIVSKGRSPEEIDDMLRTMLRQGNDLTNEEFDTLLNYFTVKQIPVTSDSLLEKPIPSDASSKYISQMKEELKTGKVKPMTMVPPLKLIGADKESVRNRVIARAEKYLAGDTPMFSSTEFNKWLKEIKNIKATDLDKKDKPRYVKEFLEFIKQ